MADAPSSWRRAGRAARDAAVMAGGMAAGQAVLLALLPLLTRRYSPADFGVLEVFHAVATSLGVVACLRYDQALVIPRPESHARGLYRLCRLLALGLGLAAGAGMLAVAATGWRWEAVSWAGLAAPLAVTVAGSGFVLAAGGLAIRHGRYGLVAAGHFSRFASMAGLQLGLFHLLGGPVGLVWGRALGEGLAAALLLVLVSPLASGAVPGAARVRALARRFDQFPRYSSSHALLNELSQGLPAVILAALFGGEAVGLFAIAFRTVQAPTAIGRRALLGLLQGRIGARRRERLPITGYATAATAALAAAGIAASLAVVPWAPDLVALAFGEAWRPSGELARWVVPWMAAALANVPAVVVLQVTGQQRVLLWYGVALFAARAAALLAGGMLGGLGAAVAALCLVGIAMNGLLVALGLSRAGGQSS